MNELLKKLRLPRIRAIYPEWVKRAENEDMGYVDFLRGILEEELCSREEKRLKTLMRKAKFPFHKTLEQFDFRVHPELRRKVFQSYLEETFVRDCRSLVFIGPPGLGKTHLSIAIGIRMVHRGLDVRFASVQGLVNKFLEAETYREKQRVLRPYRGCSLLILDEFGYLTPEPETGPVLYELISSRYEKGATIITSNKSLTEWGGIIGDNALASALIDRLLHHGDVYYLKGESYRLKDKEKSLKQEVGCNNNGSEKSASVNAFEVGTNKAGSRETGGEKTVHDRLERSDPGSADGSTRRSTESSVPKPKESGGKEK